ncbi:MAG: FAD-binding protein [Ruminococcaceae bacterium]|nr:FAD-binding protein [Oscillospiraceae bacterium]
MKYTISDICCGCSYCYRACPVDAPYYDGERNHIDLEKCISCGKCAEVCPLGAIYDADDPPAPVETHEPVTHECDALVIGAGGSGMIAACRIAEQTGKKVIVLEKTKKSGCGALHVAGPVSVADSKWALDKGAEKVLPKHVDKVVSSSNGELDRKLSENTLYALPKFFDWLCTFAPVEEKFVLREGGKKGSPGAPPGGDMPAMPGAPGGGPGDPGGMPEGMPEMMEMPAPGGGGRGPEEAAWVVDTKSLRPDSHAFHNAGQFIMENLFDYAKNLGVVILQETAAQDFILGDNGDVVGVKAQDPGGEVIVKSGCTLVAAGNLLLGNIVKKINPEFAAGFQPRYVHTSKVFTGDGAEMCERAGIPIDYDNIYISITGSLVMPCDALTVEYAEATGKKPMMPTDLRNHANRPEALLVNLNGERWVNEQKGGSSIPLQLKQPQCVSYTVMDNKTMRMKPKAAKPYIGDDGKMVMPMMPMEFGAEWNEENIQWLGSLKGGHLCIADTIEELAEKIGLPVETFKSTVERYNELCAKGVDEDMGKDPEYLLPLEEAPFYGVKTFLMSDGASGGMFIDENCRVKGKDGKVMKGLYASGDNTSGNILNKNGERVWIMNEYNWAICSGWVAGEAMIDQLGK